MADNTSQSGSVRAGYRRSRVEPIDPATISAPAKSSPTLAATQPPPPRPGSSIASHKEPKEGICKKLLRGIFLVLNIFFLAVAILMIIMGSTLWIVFRGSGLSILDVAGGAPLGKTGKQKETGKILTNLSLLLVLIINGILLAMFAMWGCEVAMISGRRKATLYLIVLVIMFGFSIFTYFRSRRIAESIQSNLNEYWGTFSTTTRSMIQDFVSSWQGKKVRRY